MISKITISTSGSTSSPKLVTHNNINRYIQNSINEIQLTADDIVLDVFPANVIAHYTVTAQPALTAGAHLVSTNFDPYRYIQLFNEYRPTVISLIPSHIQILEKTKGWHKLDMSCVRYMVTGSQLVSQDLIDSLRVKGVKLVANWYGMTEMPPPVLIAYNSDKFDLTKTNYDVSFASDGECIINGMHTGDVFNLSTGQFIKRKNLANGQTWKTHV